MVTMNSGHRDAKAHGTNDGDLVKAAQVVADDVGAQVGHELSRVRQATSELAERVFTSVRENPRASVAVLLGVGAVLGAAGHRLVFPRLTMSELIGRALNRGAISTGRSLASGMKSARKFMS